MGSFLAFALAEGRVQEDEYLAWASRQLHLPVLESRFFTEQQPDASLLQRRPDPSWSALCFPVREWDGVLMIACLEKPETPIEGAAVYVLAAPSAMATWWEQISTHQQAATVDMPDGLDGGAAAAPLSSEAMPEGLSGSAPSAAPLRFSDIVMTKPTEPAPAAAVTPTPTPDPAPAAAAVATKNPSLPKPVTPPPFGAKAAKPATDASDVSNPSISGSFDDSTRTNVNVHVNRLPEAPAEIKVVALAKTETHLLSGVAAQLADFDALVQEALRRLSGSYGKTMFLACSESGESLVPILWSESFGTPATVTPVPLENASIFKIVASTEKSYHGQVVINETNEQFFRAWNGGTTPAHVTLTPVFFKSRLVGALLGLGDQGAANMTTLRMVEKVSTDLTRRIGGGAEDVAAA